MKWNEYLLRRAKRGKERERERERCKKGARNAMVDIMGKRKENGEKEKAKCKISRKDRESGSGVYVRVSEFAQLGGVTKIYDRFSPKKC